MAVLNHAIYLTFSYIFTVYLGRSLFCHGRLFLMDCFKDEEKTVDAVNRFFLIGFYLLNSGFVMFVLRFGRTGSDLESSLELLTNRIGLVVFVMGIMHLNNLFWCSLIRAYRQQMEM